MMRKSQAINCHNQLRWVKVHNYYYNIYIDPTQYLGTSYYKKKGERGIKCFL